MHRKNISNFRPDHSHESGSNWGFNEEDEYRFEVRVEQEVFTKDDLL